MTAQKKAQIAGIDVEELLKPAAKKRLESQLSKAIRSIADEIVKTYEVRSALEKLVAKEAKRILKEEREAIVTTIKENLVREVRDGLEFHLEAGFRGRF